MDRSDSQPANADLSMTATLQPGANVRLESFLQSMKHEVEIVLIDGGIQIA
jgi:hypothetical protein